MILLAGAQGSIGSRYRTLFNMMGVKHRCVDFPRGASFQAYYEFCVDPKIESILIATPTDTHLEWIEAACQAEKPFLCEKPLSKDLKSLEALQKEYTPTGYTVCNYSYILPPPLKKISYNFYKTGKDGIIWDLCQLIYLAYRHKAELDVKTNSPYWSLSRDGIEIPYRKIEESYHSMLIDFLGHRTKTWTFEQGLEMTRVCQEITQIDDDKLNVRFS